MGLEAIGPAVNLIVRTPIGGLHGRRGDWRHRATQGELCQKLPPTTRIPANIHHLTATSTTTTTTARPGNRSSSGIANPVEVIGCAAMIARSSARPLTSCSTGSNQRCRLTIRAAAPLAAPPCSQRDNPPSAARLNLTRTRSHRPRLPAKP